MEIYGNYSKGLTFQLAQNYGRCGKIEKRGGRGINQEWLVYGNDV